MLGSAAIGSLSVRHPCSSSSASSARSRSSTAEAPIRLGGPRQRAVLAILLLNANRVVSIDRLADELYGGEPPATAVTQVQRQVSDLRKLLGPVIETRPPGYLVRAGGDTLDLSRFERLAEEAGSALAHGAHERAAALLREALALWRGPPLADLAYEPFAAAPVARLEELRLAALEQRIEAELALGEHRRLIAELEALADEHPTHERFTRPAHDRALPSGPPGGRAGRLSLAPPGAGRLVRDRADAGAARLEQAVLTRIPRSTRPRPPPRPREPGAACVLVSARSAPALEALAELAAPLAARPAAAIEVLDEEAELAPATARLSQLRSSLPPGARTAAFVSLAWGADSPGWRRRYDVELVIAAATAGELQQQPLPAQLAALLERSSADVALLSGARRATREAAPSSSASAAASTTGRRSSSAPGSAQSAGKPLRLLALRRAAAAAPADATRLLAAASIAVQGAVGIDAEPLLVEPGPAALIAAAPPPTRWCSGCRRPGGTAASARSGARSRPSCRRRCCSSTAGRGPAASPPRLRRPASPGRSAKPARTHAAPRSRNW